MNWLLKPDHSEWLVKELVSRRYKSQQTKSGIQLPHFHRGMMHEQRNAKAFSERVRLLG